MSIERTPATLLDISIAQSYSQLKVGSEFSPARDVSDGIQNGTIPLSSSKRCFNTDNTVVWQDKLLEYKLQLNTDNRGVIGATLISRSAAERAELEGLFRYQLMHDILTHGIPIHLFDPQISISFRKKLYYFNIEDAMRLDLARFPSRNHQFRNDFLAAHQLSLAEQAHLVPARDDQGNSILFPAQNKAGTDLLDAVINGVKKYSVQLNRLLTLIQDTKFKTISEPSSTGYLPSQLWQQLYGTIRANSEVARVHLQ